MPLCAGAAGTAASWWIGAIGRRLEPCCEHGPVPAPVLVAGADGTRSVAGRSAVGALVAALGRARLTLPVRAAYVDVHPPTVADVVARVTDAGEAAVVVPLLLSTGYHVNVDVTSAVEGRRAARAPALGPDPRLTDLLAERVAAVAAPDDVVVLAAAGSSDPGAAADVEVVASGLRARHAGPVVVGYGSAVQPSVPDAVAAARAAHPGRRVVVAVLLAPGFFHDRLGSAGADAVTAPLLDGRDPDPRLVAIALDRYDALAAALTT